MKIGRIYFNHKRLFLVLALTVTVAAVPFFSAFSQSSSVHKVAKGETFYSISKKYGITVDELCSANGITKNDVLKVGQSLKIPSAKTSGQAPAQRNYDIYTVQKGDTLYHIARINGITVDELKKLNSLSDASSLKAGEKLKIPSSAAEVKNTVLPDLTASDPRNYSSKKGDSSLVWPVKNPVVTYMKGKVSGVQLTAVKNESVTAIRAGTVMYVGNYRGYGQVVFIQAKSGHIYSYSGLGSIKVKKGDYVVFGDVLGTAGIDSIKGTPQICLMVFLKSQPVDPAKVPRG
ncbi:M23 family metallopeptidase [Treponema sp.]|jgi:LysM repeat protein|uniref:M23 family metallopeptidase n=1 Tax=Treponema sp. TaxID=166 RepID=UPI002579D9D2|nr:M23 family metallopeptidase [Treponema sp.]MBE6353737.1 M23 family metallopeptidase [Treponema sp.]